MRSATILVLAFALLVCLALLLQSRRRPYYPYRPYYPHWNPRWRREGFSGTFGPAFNGAFNAGGSDFGSYNVDNKKNQSPQ
jgi:hypothetical protein